MSKKRTKLRKLKKWEVAEVPCREYLREAREAHHELHDGLRLVILRWRKEAHAVVLMEDFEVLETLLELDPLTLVEVAASIDDREQKRLLARVIQWIDSVQ